MKNTNPIFSLKNFRSFGEEGADFELAPITVLTGCNSAGKSSLVKALLLLSLQPISNESVMEVIKPYELDKNADYDRYNAGADVTKNLPSKVLKVSSRELGLGRFDKVIQGNAEDGIIIMSYRMWSQYLHEEVIVKRLFTAKNDILNDGGLTEFTIEKLDGTIIYKYFWNAKELTAWDDVIGDVSFSIGWDEEDNINTIFENYKKYSEICDYYAWEDRQNDSDLQKLLQKMDEEHPQLEIRKNLKDYDRRMEEIRIKYGEEIDDYRDVAFYASNNSDSSRTSTVDQLREMKRREADQEFDWSHKKEMTARSKNNFYINVVNECIAPHFITNISYIDSSSASVKRLYSIEDENKMCVALGKLVKQGRTGSYVNKWLKMFDIADSIEVVGTNEGIGIMVYLIKGDEKHLLADEGYGITQLVSLLLQMQNTIIDNTRFRTIIDPETFEDTYEHYYLNSFIAIEEPEVHLHPKYQSLLADMFIEAYQKYNIHFIIETHSEYLIRKLQVLVADKENKLTPNDVSLNYVEKDKSGISTNRKIEILEDGRLSGPFGPGFFDEADSLAMDLMKYKVRR